MCSYKDSIDHRSVYRNRHETMTVLILSYGIGWRNYSKVLRDEPNLSALIGIPFFVPLLLGSHSRLVLGHQGESPHIAHVL